MRKTAQGAGNRLVLDFTFGSPTPSAGTHSSSVRARGGSISLVGDWRTLCGEFFSEQSSRRVQKVVRGHNANQAIVVEDWQTTDTILPHDVDRFECGGC
jgi:hypothetical protein